MARGMYEVGQFFTFKAIDHETHPDVTEGVGYKVVETFPMSGGRIKGVKFIDDAGDDHYVDVRKIKMMEPPLMTDAGALEYEEAMRGLDLVKIKS